MTYLLDFSGRAQRALLDFIGKGAVEIASFDAPAIERASTLMAKYEDLPTRVRDSWDSRASQRDWIGC